MTYRGCIKNGVILLEEPAPLPEGAQVSVSILDARDGIRPFFNRREILNLPIEQRREILRSQAERVASDYPSGEFSDWQGGDIVE